MREADINPDIENLVQAFGVSRETIDRLEIYQSLLEKWQSSINLVGPATLHQFWTRHVADSAQLVALAPPFGAEVGGSRERRRIPWPCDSSDMGIATCNRWWGCAFA